MNRCTVWKENYSVSWCYQQALECIILASNELRKKKFKVTNFFIIYLCLSSQHSQKRFIIS